MDKKPIQPGSVPRAISPFSFNQIFFYGAVTLSLVTIFLVTITEGRVVAFKYPSSAVNLQDISAYYFFSILILGGCILLHLNDRTVHKYNITRRIC